MKTKVIRQNEWHEVYEELTAEELKLSVYDDFIIRIMGNVKDKKVLDYGCGPGVIDNVLEKLDADVDVYDINERILKMVRKRLPNVNIEYDATGINVNTYDFVLCNLVLCIVEDDEVTEISKIIYNSLKNGGIALVGFCNPKIFNIHETKLDKRHHIGKRYKQNHEYLKEKKEGGYFIYEKHRPIEWYDDVFKKAGFGMSKRFFTAPYDWKGKRNIKDFVIFRLTK
jgi:2-polyprenyl-3-methyl-5-hydroxy-6-metoxy-1,4-benzoquinol methylase